jgi:hypothetical protein
MQPFKAHSGGENLIAMSFTRPTFLPTRETEVRLSYSFAFIVQRSWEYDFLSF